MYKSFAAALSAATLSLMLCINAFAMDKPKGSVVLTIGGAVGVSNSADGNAQFDLEMLETFSKVIIKTETPWLDGMTTFQGVRLKDLIEHVKGTGEKLKAIALNDYAVDIPFADFQKYDVIIAYKSNGKYMSIRDKGPLWIIYPWNHHEELKTETYHGRSIWQLTRLEIE